MKQRSKRLLSVLLTLAMLLGMVPGVAWAEGTEGTGNAPYDTDKDTTVINQDATPQRMMMLGATQPTGTKIWMDGETLKKGDAAWTTTDQSPQHRADCYDLDAGEYWLDADITIDHAIHIMSGKAVTVDLNGHGITYNGTRVFYDDTGKTASEEGYNSSKKSYAESIFVILGGTLTLKDSASAKGAHYYCIDETGLAHVVDSNEAAQSMAATYTDDQKAANPNTGTTGSFTGGYITGGKGSLTYRTNGNEEGGGAAEITDKGTLTMHGGTIIGNTGLKGGGVLVHDDSTFSMNGGTIIGNMATYYDGSYGGGGGGIYAATNTENHVAVNGGEICYNTIATEKGYGGGIRVEAGTLDLAGGKIHHNFTKKKGGGISNDGTLTISGDVEIYNNTAGSGGGIESADNVTMNGGVIYDNRADYGGGIYYDGDSDGSEAFVMDGGTVKDNTANAGGGGIYSDGIFTLKNGVIQNNTAVGYSKPGKDYRGIGGGVYCVDGVFTMEGGTISKNKAGQIEESLNGQGGGLYINDRCQAYLKGGTISGNTVIGADAKGGGIYHNGDRFFLNGGTIQNNTSGGKGGGVYAGKPITLYNNSSITRYDDGNEDYLEPEVSSLSPVSATVLNNTSGQSTIDNVYLADAAKIQFGMSENADGEVEGADKIVITAALATKSDKIGITLKNGTGVFTDGIADAAARTAAERYFFSDNAEYTVAPAEETDGYELRLMLAPPVPLQSPVTIYKGGQPVTEDTGIHVGSVLTAKASAGNHLTYTWYYEDDLVNSVFTGEPYVVRGADVGHRFVVVASQAGSVPVSSAATPAVTVLYEIHNLEELEEFQRTVNGGYSYAAKTEGAVPEGANTQGETVKLMADIDMSEKYGADKESWTPIGTYGTGQDNNPFKGIFDGNGHKITGLYVHDAADAGLFGYVYHTTIKNLTVSGDVRGTVNAAVLLARARNLHYRYINTISNCHVKAPSAITSTGEDGSAGALLGRAQNSTTVIENCTVEANVTVSGAYRVGGIAGSIGKAKISNCSNSGSVICDSSSSSQWSQSVGGIAGDAGNGGDNFISDCSNSGAVTLKFGQKASQQDAGGIVGNASLTLKNCYNTGEVAVSNSSSPTGDCEISIGGLAGRFSQGESKVEHCSNSGAVKENKASGKTVYVGGLIGYLTDCQGVLNNYNDGSVTLLSVNGSATSDAKKCAAGGLFGRMNSKTTVTYCHNYVAVSRPDSGKVLCSGIVGFKNNSDITFNGCYDNGTNPALESVTQLTADGFKAQQTFVGAGWDFTNIWEMKAGALQYPVFKAFKLLKSVDIEKGGTSLGTTVPQLNDELTADADGATPVAFQWYRVKDGAETPIEGANEATYKVDPKDAGCILRVKATQDKDQNGAPLRDNAIVKSADTVAVFAAAKNINLKKHYPTLQAAFDDASLENGDTVQLLTDVTESVRFGDSGYDKTGKTVTLDLNGNSVTGSGIYAITVCIGSLTLTDSGSGGKISNPSGGAVSVNGGATFIMKDGSLCNNKPTSSYGGAGVVNLEQRYVQGAVQSGKFQMEGGAIENNESSANTGCGVYMSPGSTFTMTGGRISNNRGINSVGVYVAGGSSFTMTGGEITGNEATGNETSSYGAGVRVQVDGSATFGGTAKVSDNVLKIEGQNAKADNVDLQGSIENTWAKIMVSTTKPFTTGASVGVTLGTGDGKGVFTKDIKSAAAQAKAKPYFFSDNTAYSVLSTVAADDAANQLKLDVVVYAKLENLSIANSTKDTRDGSGDESTYPQVGDALKANATDNSDTPSKPVTYQWYRADSKNGPYTAIPDAPGETYTAAAADVGKYLKVKATQDKDEKDDTRSRPITKEAVIGPVALRDAPEPFEEKHPNYPTSADGQIRKKPVPETEIFENLYYSDDNGKTWKKVQTNGNASPENNLRARTYLFSYRVSDGEGGTLPESKTTTVILTPKYDLIWLKLTKVSPENKMANEVGATIQAETNFGSEAPAGVNLTYKWYRIRENADGTTVQTELTAVEGRTDRYTIAAEDAGCKVLAEVTWTYNDDQEQTKTLSTPTPIIISTAPTLRGVSGKVTRGGADVVSGATVELRQGNTVIARTTTDVNGDYSFAANSKVPDGEYNIVVTTNTDPAVTKTETVKVSGETKKDVDLPSKAISSTVVVQGNIPAITVSSLDGVADKQIVGDGQAVEVKLTVEGKEDLTAKKDTELTDEQKAEKQNQTEVKQAATNAIGSGAVVDFLDMGILKTTTETGSTTTEAIRDTGSNVLSIRVPYLTAGRYQFGIYRKHVDDSNVESIKRFTDITTGGIVSDGTFKTGNGYLEVYASKFSTYAIAYTTTPTINNNNNNKNNNNNTTSGGGGGGSSDSSSYPVTVGQTANGTVKADRSSASAGTRVTLTVTPASGCKVDSVTVTDKNGKTVPVTRNSDGTYRFNMPESAVTVNVTFAKKFADPAGTGVADWLNTDDHILYIRGYNEKGVSTVRPDNNITRAEAAMMFYRLLKNQDVTVTRTFTDVSEGQWYAQPIGVLASLGIVGGYGDGTFLPNRTITRAEFAKIATRFAIATGGKVQFSDVPEGHWAGGFIATAADYGWIGGYEDGTYRPDGFMTRAAAAKIINYMLGRSADREYVLANRENLVKYTDLTDPSVWYYFELVEASVAHDFTVTDGVEKWK